MKKDGADKKGSTFLTIGPSGTGKTATAKKLAEKLGMDVVHIDAASLYPEAKGLLGSPPALNLFETTEDLTEKFSASALLDEMDGIDPVLLKAFREMTFRAVPPPFTNFRERTVISDETAEKIRPGSTGKTAKQGSPRNTGPQ